jgi:TetR/AcrR family transcriptional regulator, transcriptional repressor of aconitase
MENEHSVWKIKSECSFSIIDADMPRVSQEHRDARRRQILDAARRCFAVNGFHATSMQDVLREAGLSAGAVYGYFASKEDIVVAIASEALGTITGVVDELLHDDPPPLHEVLARIVAELERLDAERGVANIAVQAWGEALRNPVLREHAGEIYGKVRGAMVRLVRAYQARGDIDPAADPLDVASVLVSVAPGFFVQRAVMGSVDAGTFRRGLAALC